MRSEWIKYAATGAIILLALVFPLLGVKSYYLHVAILGLLHAILALGLNLIAGYTGQLSLAQAAFFGIGSYVSALLMLNVKMSFWLAAPIGACAAALVGILFGLPTLRLKGPYFVISTLGFGEIIRLVFLNWESVTRGPNGLTGIPAPDDVALGFVTLTFDTKTGAYYLVLVTLLAVLALYYNLVYSRIGRALRAIHSDQIAAEVMGINLTFYKVFAFALSAFLSGLAGALYAGYIRFISPDTFTIGEAVNILIMMVLGGMGTIAGPIIGAVSITYLLETMRVFADYRLIIYGLLMFFIILYMPQGLVGVLAMAKDFLAARFPLPISRGTDEPPGQKGAAPVKGEI
ncbi:MAG: branched-chain amino acid ABC transporter permease [Negativicutes bacterium]|nr:branched-chain amino acid ABC transporter permease [Negativicutes bacterium]